MTDADSARIAALEEALAELNRQLVEAELERDRWKLRASARHEQMFGDHSGFLVDAGPHAGFTTPGTTEVWE